MSNLTNRKLLNNQSPGLQKKPNYPLVIIPFKGCVCATFRHKIIAQTRDALIMTESDYPAVYYFPRVHVHIEFMKKTEHSSYCPYKGSASYWTISVDGWTAENAAWSYEKPYREVAQIIDRMAFYPSKIDTIEIT